MAPRLPVPLSYRSGRRVGCEWSGSSAAAQAPACRTLLCANAAEKHWAGAVQPILAARCSGGFVGNHPRSGCTGDAARTQRTQSGGCDQSTRGQRRARSALWRWSLQHHLDAAFTRNMRRYPRGKHSKLRHRTRVGRGRGLCLACAADPARPAGKFACGYGSKRLASFRLHLPGELKGSEIMAGLSVARPSTPVRTALSFPFQAQSP